MNAHMFLITHEKFYIRNVFPLEDIDENVTSYVTQKSIGN